jgi:hypothetical protein
MPRFGEWGVKRRLRSSPIESGRAAFGPRHRRKLPRCESLAFVDCHFWLIRRSGPGRGGIRGLPASSRTERLTATFSPACQSPSKFSTARETGLTTTRSYGRRLARSIGFQCRMRPRAAPSRSSVDSRIRPMAPIEFRPLTSLLRRLRKQRNNRWSSGTSTATSGASAISWVRPTNSRVSGRGASSRKAFVVAG